MRVAPTAVLALALATSTIAAAAEVRDESFIGLWGAARSWPVTQGPLALVPRDGALVADLAGFSVPVTVGRGGEHTFELTDGLGTFRGRIAPSGSVMAGFWRQAPSPTSGSTYSTPVTLTRDGGVWRGQVTPLEQSFSYYLPVTRAADGSLATYLRNPQRNDGIFTPVTTLERDGDRLRLIGNRRGSKERSVLFEGRLETDPFAMQFPGRSDWYRFTKVEAEGTSPFYPRGKPAPRYRYAKPLQRDDGWPTATLEEVGISRPVIEAIVQRAIDAPMETLHSGQIHSVLIARHGKLVLEEYFHGYHRDKPHDLRSAAKSGLSVLVGAAMQAGIAVSESTPVYETMLGTLPADIDPRKRKMTLVNLLTMTGGHFCDDGNPDAPGNEDTMQEQEKERDWYKFILQLPMDRVPGEKLVYCSIDPHLGGGVLSKVAGEPLPELFDRLVARPLKFGPYHMFLGPLGEGYMGGGWQLLPRDFMKLAQLMVNEGEWQGQRIFSKEWARRSGAALRPIGSRGDMYGYLWWSKEYPYRDRKVRGIFAAGNGGQISMAIPELDLVIVFNGGNYADAPQRAIVPEQILSAVDAPS